MTIYFGCEYIEKKIRVYCPYCGSKNRSIVGDFYIGSPPLSNTLYVQWACEECMKSFRTDHELDENGELVIV